MRERFVNMERRINRRVGFIIYIRPLFVAYFTRFRANYTPKGGIAMSHINPQLREQFESMPTDLKNEILSRNVQLETMSDLMAVLEQIVQED